MSASNRHRDAWELLPWYVNRTLEGRDLDLVTTHLAECAVCRDEIARYHSLATAMQTAPETAQNRLAQGLERVLASIDAIEAAGTPEGGWRRWLSVPSAALRELFQHTPPALGLRRTECAPRPPARPGDVAGGVRPARAVPNACRQRSDTARPSADRRVADPRGFR